MPIYEYACAACGHHVEALQKISDDPLVTCPACEEDALERLVSSSSFSLKGGGWYADGYGAEPPKKKTTPEGEKKSDKTETKKETKPAKKPASDD